jgi:hypothetical protein
MKKKHSSTQLLPHPNQPGTSNNKHVHIFILFIAATWVLPAHIYKVGG